MSVGVCWVLTELLCCKLWPSDSSMKYIFPRGLGRDCGGMALVDASFVEYGLHRFSLPLHLALLLCSSILSICAAALKGHWWFNGVCVWFCVFVCTLLTKAVLVCVNAQPWMCVFAFKIFCNVCLSLCAFVYYGSMDVNATHYTVWVCVCTFLTKAVFQSQALLETCYKRASL